MRRLMIQPLVLPRKREPRALVNACPLFLLTIRRRGAEAGGWGRGTAYLRAMTSIFQALRLDTISRIALSPCRQRVYFPKSPTR